MKTSKFIPIVTCLSILCGCGHSEMSEEKAIALLNGVGGIAEINKEARVIFDQYGTNVSTVIYGQPLASFPAISSLASSVFFQTNSGWSVCIEIPFGSHFQRNFIFVFDSKRPIVFPYASNCIEVTTNIFIGK